MKLKYLFGLAMFLALVTNITAQISPGDLSKYHAKLEGIANCTKCHVLGQEVSNAKCLECHTTLQAQINSNKGYHVSSDVTGAKCASCHSEHNGREFELVHWKQGQQSFAHESTGFPLEGAHTKLDCRACHKASLISDAELKSKSDVNFSTTFLGLGTACLSCHENEHRGQLSENCQSCHTTDAWVPATKFSHAKAAYPLTGKHAQVDCAKCHAVQTVTEAASDLIQKKEHVGVYTQYKKLNFANCTPCHEDVHKGKFSTNCASCHVTSGFQTIVGEKFDHSKTAFPLIGKHALVACLKCHTSGNMTLPIAHSACRDCHSDTHRGQFAQRADKGACESCHSWQGFVPSLYDVTQHNLSGYPLTGSHLAVACALCHTQVKDDKGATYAQFTFKDTSCKGCHEDIHLGQADQWIGKSGCEFCHVTDSWHRASFDHSLSRFPLEGKHKDVACATCHAKVGGSERMVTLKPLEIACGNCHKDIHQGQFARADQGEKRADCKRCHTPANWHNLVFDHNRDAKYALDGAHAKVACTGCHKPQTDKGGTQYVLYKPLGTECANCHFFSK